MARKKVIRKSTLQNWDDVNDTLRLIAEYQSSVDARVAAYNEDEANRRSKLDAYCGPIKNNIGELEDEIKLFCEDHRADFGKKQSLSLSNGTVGYRLGTPKAKTLKGFTWKAVLEVLKRTMYKDNYIRVKEEVNRERIIQDYQTKSIDDESLKLIGVEVAQEETFGYTVNLASEQPAA